jgi:hypothetical protein
MTKKETLKTILLYLSSSSMSEQERMMRISLLPHMEEVHLKSLVKILKDEVNETIDVYLKSI